MGGRNCSQSGGRNIFFFLFFFLGGGGGGGVGGGGEKILIFLKKKKKELAKLKGGPTAKRQRRAEVMTAKIKGRSTHLKAEKGTVIFKLRPK